MIWLLIACAGTSTPDDTGHGVDSGHGDDTAAVDDSGTQTVDPATLVPVEVERSDPTTVGDRHQFQNGWPLKVQGAPDGGWVALGRPRTGDYDVTVMRIAEDGAVRDGWPVTVADSFTAVGMENHAVEGPDGAVYVATTHTSSVRLTRYTAQGTVDWEREYFSGEDAEVRGVDLDGDEVLVTGAAGSYVRDGASACSVLRYGTDGTELEPLETVIEAGSPCFAVRDGHVLGQSFTVWTAPYDAGTAGEVSQTEILWNQNDPRGTHFGTATVGPTSDWHGLNVIDPSAGTAATVDVDQTLLVMTPAADAEGPVLAWTTRPESGDGSLSVVYSVTPGTPTTALELASGTTMGALRAGMDPDGRMLLYWSGDVDLGPAVYSSVIVPEAP